MKCPYCNYENKEDALSCNLCQALLKREEAPIEQSSQNETQEKREEDESFGGLFKSFRLIKESFQVLRQDQEIAVFALLGLIAMILIGVSLIFIFDLYDELMTKSQFTSPNFITAFSIGYFLYLFIFVFCNAGITITAYERLSGRNPTFITTLNKVWVNIGIILGWAFFASTIGVALMLLEKKSNALARFFGLALDIIWSLATFLIIPILVIEKLDAPNALIRSAELFKKTWGENIVGQFSMNSFFTYISIVIALIVPFFLEVILAVFHTTSIFYFYIILFIVITLLLLEGILYVSLKSIYAAAVYYYATTGEVPHYFTAEVITEEFCS